jgi:hypothetical protein
MSKKVCKVYCELPKGLILQSIPGVVDSAFDGVGHAPVSTTLKLRHGMNRDVDEAEITAWMTRNAGLKIVKRDQVFIVSDGRPGFVDPMERALSDTRNCRVV